LIDPSLSSQGFKDCYRLTCLDDDAALVRAFELAPEKCTTQAGRLVRLTDSVLDKTNTSCGL